MKKIYKILGVILLTFFVGMINAYAAELRGFYLGGPRAVRGEQLTLELRFDDYNFNYKDEYTAKAHFYNMGNPEVVVDVDLEKNKITITNDFVPERVYSLSYLELMDKKGDITKYSSYESGEYIKIENYSTSGGFHVKEAGPVKKISFYSEGYKSKNDNDYYKVNEKVHFKIESNSNIDGGTISLGYYDNSEKKEISFELKKIANDVYEIDLGTIQNIKPGGYSLSGLKIISGGNTYTYSSLYNEYEVPYIGSITVYKTFLNDFSIDNDTFALNEKTYLNLKTNDKASSGEIKFKGDNKQFTVSIHDLDTKPYIIIPYTAKLGEYELEYISLTGKNQFANYSHIPSLKYIYSSKEEYIDKNEIGTIYEKRDYNIKINVVKDESTIIGELLELDNDLITDDVIKEIKNVKDGVEINIDASNNTTVKSEVFEAIKGHDKTLNIKYNDYSWTFNGKDITEPKKLKVNFAVADFKKYEEITKAVKNGALVVFSNYGALPGKATIRFNIKEELAKEIKDNKLYLYMYDSDETQKFELIDTGIKQDKEGFYEIKLSNTSSYYVVTPEEIADKYLIGYNFPILLVVIIILSIITVIGIVVLIILKVRKGKKKKKVNKEETPKVESSESVEKTPEEEKVVEEVKKDEKEI